MGMEGISYGQGLNVGEPRTVRMIYYLPSDLAYRADVVQKMKDDIRTVQNFYAEQMQAHGYGNMTFRFETDDHGEPIVHRVDSQHPYSFYAHNPEVLVHRKLSQMYDISVNIYFIVFASEDLYQGNDRYTGGFGLRNTKNGGIAGLLNNSRWDVVAHELGHAFGLQHDFRKNSYIMSYVGDGFTRSLSVCTAKHLSVHTYFNPRIPTAEAPRPTIELISSPTYPAGAESVPVRLKVKSSEGINQLQLYVGSGVHGCRGLTGEKEAVVEFEYDGVYGMHGYTSLSDVAVHLVHPIVVDSIGNMNTITFRLSEISQGQIAHLEGHSKKVRSVAFSPDRKILASGSLDYTVKLWDVNGEKNIHTFKHAAAVKSVVFSPDGMILASGGNVTGRNDGINLWDMTTKEKISTLNHGGSVFSLSFSPDGTMLASGSDDLTIKLWNVETKEKITTLHYGYNVESVSFSHDGTILASGAYDGTIKLWDIRAETEIVTLKYPIGIDSVLFSPNGTTFVAATLGDTIHIWNVHDIQVGTEIAYLVHKDNITSLAFSPDGAILASGTLIGSIKLWDFEKEIEITSFGHTSGITSLSFSHDGTTLASGTSDGTIRLWDVPLPEPDFVVSIPDPNLALEVRKILDVPPHVDIRLSDIVKLNYISIMNGQITDLTGLENAINLRYLALPNHQISDITPLANLKKLRLLRPTEQSDK